MTDKKKSMVFDADTVKNAPYNMKHLLQGMVNGDIRSVELSDTFRFKCETCGKCCFNQHILVNPYDIWMLFETGTAQKLGITHTTMLYDTDVPFITLTLGGNSGAPVALINFRKMPADEGEPESKTTFCPFITPVLDASDLQEPPKTPEEFDRLAEEGKLPFKCGKDGRPMYVCAIHEASPTICRSYPLGRTVQVDKETGENTTQYIQVKIECGDRSVTQEVGKWISELELDKRWEASDKYYDLVRLIAENKDKLPEEVRWLVANVVYDFDGWGARKRGLSYEEVIVTGKALVTEFLAAQQKQEHPEEENPS